MLLNSHVLTTQIRICSLQDEKNFQFQALCLCPLPIGLCDHWRQRSGEGGSRNNKELAEIGIELVGRSCLKGEACSCRKSFIIVKTHNKAEDRRGPKMVFQNAEWEPEKTVCEPSSIPFASCQEKTYGSGTICQRGNSVVTPPRGTGGLEVGNSEGKCLLASNLMTHTSDCDYLALDSNFTSFVLYIAYIGTRRGLKSSRFYWDIYGDDGGNLEGCQLIVTVTNYPGGIRTSNDGPTVNEMVGQLNGGCEGFTEEQIKGGVMLEQGEFQRREEGSNRIMYVYFKDAPAIAMAASIEDDPFLEESGNSTTPMAPGDMSTSPSLSPSPSSASITAFSSIFATLYLAAAAVGAAGIGAF